MQELNIIIEELKGIRAQIERLTAIQERREKQREKYRAEAEQRRPHPEEITGIIANAFSDQDRIKRADLYTIEKEEARKQGRQAINKQAFYRMVVEAGHGIVKSNGEYYFCK